MIASKKQDRTIHKSKLSDYPVILHDFDLLLFSSHHFIQHKSLRFVYKVQLQIAGKLNEEVECIGEPRLKKKDAAESTAEGALWYLKNEGHIR